MPQPLRNIHPDTNAALTLTEDVLGPHAHAYLRNALHLTEDVTLTDCTAPVLQASGALYIHCKPQGPFAGKARARVYLFDILADAAQERHCILLFAAASHAYTIQELIGILTGRSVTMGSAELAALQTLAYHGPAALFSTLDYTQTMLVPPVFPPEQDDQAPESFTQEIRKHLRDGLAILAKFQLKTTVDLSADGNAPATIDLQPALEAAHLGSLCRSVDAHVQIRPRFYGAELHILHNFENVTANTLPFAPKLEYAGVLFPLGSGARLLPSFECGGSLKIPDSRDETERLTIDAGFDPNSKQLGITITHFPTFAELAQTFTERASAGGTLEDLLGAFLPDAAMDTLGSLTIRELYLSIDCATKKVSDLKFVVAADKSFEVARNLELNAVLLVDMTHPFQPDIRTTRVEVLGQCRLPGAELDALLTVRRSSGVVDEIVFLAQTGPGTGIHSRDLLGAWFGGHGLYLPDISLLDAEFSAYRSGDIESITFELDVAAGWNLAGTDLALDGAGLEVSLSRTASDANARWAVDEASAQGTLRIGPAHFYMFGDYDGDGRIWSFRAGTTPDTKLSLQDFTEAARRALRLPEPGALLKKLNAVVISECALEYTTAEDAPANIQFLLRAEIETEHPEYHNLKLGDIVFNFRRDGKDTAFALRATVSAGGLSEFLNAVKEDAAFSLGVTLPAEIRNLSTTAADLYASYDSSTHTYVFQAEAAVSIGGLLHSLGILNEHSDTGAKSRLGLVFSNDESFRHRKLFIEVAGGFTLGQVPVLNTILPDGDSGPKQLAVKKLEVNYDLTKVSGDGQPGTESDWTFAMYLDNPLPAGETDELVFSGIHGTQTTGGHEIRITGGHMYSTGGKGLHVDFSRVFPVQLDIRSLFLAEIHSGGASNAIYGTEIGLAGDFDLSGVPIVGDFLQAAHFRIEALRIVHTKAAISAKDLERVNEFLGRIHTAPLTPGRPAASDGKASPAAYPQGFTLQGSLILGSGDETIPLHSNFGSHDSPDAPLDPAQSGAGSAPTPVGKKYGPVTIKSVSLGLASGKLAITISGSLHVGPLGLDLIGFQIKSPLNEFSPSVSLEGLGIEYQKPPLTIEGMFRHGRVKIPDPADTAVPPRTIALEAYSGEIVLGYKQYNLTAMGSYAKLPDGDPTVFIYGFLGAPLGGLPVLLYVTGAAAGFGYNRAMTLPAPETVHTFPLIQPVLPDATPPDFDAVNLDFPPRPGSFWGAVGLRATSFKMIESFVLLALRFGEQFEIDVIGIAGMQFPLTNPAQAKVRIGLVARIIPERGIIAINGAFLPGSYIFAPEAHISGGFALLCVTKDQSNGQWKGAREGDFVYTMGGYATSYAPQPYYPRPARLELNWCVNSDLTVKADAYYAITPEAMMAGGHLDVNYVAGGSFSIHVHFQAGADFIMYWQPYHYKGDIYANLSVGAHIDVDLWLFSIHTHVDFDVGADIHFWGPDFSGHAAVHVHVIVSFTVPISFGNDEQEPAPLDWNAFQHGFLPPPEQVLNANIARGLDAAQSSPDKHIVNAKELEFVCGTAIPAGQAQFGGVELNSNAEFGIKPMAKTSQDVESKLTVRVKKDGMELTAAELQHHFTVEAIRKNMPAALWKPAAKSGEIPDADGKALLEGLLSGLHIKVKPSEHEGPHTVTPHADTIHMPATLAAKSFSYAGYTVGG